MDVVARDSRVRLTTLDWTNFYQHYQWSNDRGLQQEEVATTFPREPVYVFKERFEAMMNPDREALDLEIHTATGTLIGVAFIDWQANPGTPQIGLTICDTTYRGRGLGQAAFRLLLDVCFHDRSFQRVQATARPSQNAWLRLLRHAGFTASAPDASSASFILSYRTHRNQSLSRSMTAKAA